MLFPKEDAGGDWALPLKMTTQVSLCVTESIQTVSPVLTYSQWFQFARVLLKLEWAEITCWFC